MGEQLSRSRKGKEALRSREKGKVVELKLAEKEGGEPYRMLPPATLIKRRTLVESPEEGQGDYRYQGRKSLLPSPVQKGSLQENVSSLDPLLDR